MLDKEQEILRAEESLRDAMLNSDVATLDSLIADELIFTNHVGSVFTKEMDLAAHRSGMQRLHSLVPSEQRVAVFGDSAIVSVKIQLAGSYDGNPFSGEFRYTRVWQHMDGHWRIIAGHFSPVVSAS